MKNWTKGMLASTMTISIGSIATIGALQIDKANNPDKYKANKVKKYILPNIFEKPMDKSKIMQKIHSWNLEEINEKLKQMKMEPIQIPQVYVVNGTEFSNINDAKQEIIKNIDYETYIANRANYQDGELADDAHQINDSIHTYYEYNGKVYTTQIEAQKEWLKNNVYKVNPIKGQGSFFVYPFNKMLQLDDWDYGSKPTEQKIGKDLRVVEDPIVGTEGKDAVMGTATLSVNGAQIIKGDTFFQPSSYLENGDIINHYTISDFHSISNVDGEHVWSISVFGHKYTYTSKNKPRPVLGRILGPYQHAGRYGYVMDRYFIEWENGVVQNIGGKSFSSATDAQRDAVINVELTPVDETLKNNYPRYTFTLNGRDYIIDSTSNNPITENDIHLNLSGSSAQVPETRFKRYNLFWKGVNAGYYDAKLADNFANPFTTNNLHIRENVVATPGVKNTIADVPNNRVREYLSYDSWDPLHNDITDLVSIKFTRGYKFQNRFYKTTQTIMDKAITDSHLKAENSQKLPVTFDGKEYPGLPIAIAAIKNKFISLIEESKDTVDKKEGGK